MTRPEIVSEIASKTGVKKGEVLACVEAFKTLVKNTLINGENVYLRGFGSFYIKKRAQKKARDMAKNTSIIIPAHIIPAFKPGKYFLKDVKTSKKIK